MNNNLFRLSARDWMVCCGEYIIIISMISFLFYDSFLSFFILFPGIFIYIKHFKVKMYDKKKEELEKGFLRSLQSLSASLAAGLSPERSLYEAVYETEKTCGEKSVLVRELKIVSGQVLNGRRMEKALDDFAKKSDIESIKDFALIFNVAKHSGGSFVKAIARCIQMMNVTKETQDEIRILIRSKQYEHKIMSIIPLGIIAYMRLSSAGFMAVLYHNILGVGIMTGCLIVYVVSILIGEKLCRINL